MKKKFLLFLILSRPTITNALENSDTINASKIVNTNAIVQQGAIVSDAFNANNLNAVIIGMVVVILILVGATMFAQKK